MDMRKMDSNETAPGHCIGTDDDGNRLFLVPQGWAPVGEYELDADGYAYEPKAGAEREGAASKLARQLYTDDLSRADEVPVQRDGHRAYDGWLRAASEAGDRDTREALEAVDRDAFAAAWNALVEGS
jgi:hypothetical protein